MRIYLNGLLLILLASCSSTNQDPDILSKAPYNAIRYQSTVNPKQQKSYGEVSVTTRGYEAYVRNTIPKLYDEALKILKQQNPPLQTAVISNIDFDVYTKRESFLQSYQDCHYTTEYRQESYQNCSGYGASQRCYTSYRSTPHNVQKCETKYRTVEADVLYQVAKGQVYAAPAGETKK